MHRPLPHLPLSHSLPFETCGWQGNVEYVEKRMDKMNTSDGGMTNGAPLPLVS